MRDQRHWPSEPDELPSAGHGWPVQSAASRRSELWHHPGVAVAIRYTRNNIARGCHPDVVTDDRCYLIKNVPLMRLTYQVRLLTHLAESRAVMLVIRLPAGSRLSRDLRRFVRGHRLVRVERGG